MSLRFIIKSVLRSSLPPAWHFSIFFPLYLETLVKEKTQMRVFRGPFKGLRYAEQSHASVLIPKLLGIYEREVAGCIEELLLTPFDLIVDIGAAEGYYAVGFAKFHKNKPKVCAFEMSESGRDILKKIATLNEVADRISILGECTPGLLRQHLNAANALVICDVEGAEGGILDPAVIPQLKVTSLLVELHKRKCPGIQELLMERFSCSHEITAFHQTSRSNRDFPFSGALLPFCPRVYIENCVSEFRQPWEENMTWFYMRPRRELQA